MATAGDSCTLLVATPEKVALPTQAELSAELESSDMTRKVAALKKAILLLLSGEDMPRILMTVIRYCITQEDHTLQKLLMLYWEVVRKYDAAGKLLPEMILVWCVSRAAARRAMERLAKSAHRHATRSPSQQRPAHQPDPPQRVPAWLHAAVPVQVEGAGAAGAAGALHQGMPRAPPSLCPPQRGDGRLQCVPALQGHVPRCAGRHREAAGGGGRRRHSPQCLHHGL